MEVSKRGKGRSRDIKQTLLGEKNVVEHEEITAIASEFEILALFVQEFGDEVIDKKCIYLETLRSVGRVAGHLKQESVSFQMWRG